MKRSTALSALAVAAIVAAGAPSFAHDSSQSHSGPAAPGAMSGHESQNPAASMPDQQSGAMSDQSRNPSEQMPGEQSEIPASDATRIVGQVVQIDREQGMVALATDEGMLLVQAPPHALQSIDVGDIVAVPRSIEQGPRRSPDTDSPSAMPRMEPPGDSPLSPHPHMEPSAPSTDKL